MAGRPDRFGLLLTIAVLNGVPISRSKQGEADNELAPSAQALAACLDRPAVHLSQEQKRELVADQLEETPSSDVYPTAVLGEGVQSMTTHRRGTLIGLAIGDALGGAVEFKSPGSFKPVTGYRDGGPHGLDAGEWTDDTSMALALADSIAAVGWDLNDQADRYVQWWKTGKYSVNGRCFDIGITTRSALGNFVAKKNAFTSGDRSDRASGNGSIMRLAPVPIRFGHLYADQLDELSRLAEESSLPTHASEQCVSACRYLATVLAALIQGEDRAAVLSPDWKRLQQLNAIKPLHPLIQEIAQGSFRQKQPPAIQGSGWVVKSLEASLWAFHDAETFEEAVLKAVNLGDDADTTGAICGQLAGAFWGESGIPQSLRSGLARMDMIEEALEGRNSNRLECRCPKRKRFYDDQAP